MASTGENDQALRKILDMTRLISIVLLFLHFYYQCYAAFVRWDMSLPFTDRVMVNIINTGLFSSFHKAKLIALGFLAVSLLGAKGSKSDKVGYRPALAYLLCGLLLYFASLAMLRMGWQLLNAAMAYMAMTLLGFLLVLTGGTLLTRIIRDGLSDEVSNAENETFPQEERLLVNENSVNLPMRYRLKNKWRKGFLNCVGVYRSVLVSGSAGAGKSAYIINSFIKQTLNKEDPFTMMVYDFKFPDLSKIAYNHWLKNKHKYPAKSECYFINFDDPSRSHRGNPLEPSGMTDITDATESSRTILLGLNKEWQKRQGDFFVESPINLFTSVIWYLRKYRNGEFCTLPHAIEFLQLEYNALFTLLRSQSEVEVLVNPFINAYLADVMEQLEGQIASAKIALGRLASPQLYYVLSGNDFSLDINNPEAPKVLCIGNNPQKTQTYGAVLSLFANRLLKVINKKNKLKSILIFDEYPTIYVDLIPTISTGRSNRISCLMGIQSIKQLVKEYGKEAADVIMSIAGNMFAGQESGENAKHISEHIGKIMQDRVSLSISDSGTSVSKSKQLDYAVPASKIAQLSAGQFCGILSDIPDIKMELKAFDCEVINDWDGIAKEEAAYQEIPLIEEVTPEMIQKKFFQIKKDVQEIARVEIERMLNNPALAHLVIRK